MLYLPYEKYYTKYGHKRDALFEACKECILNGVLVKGTRLPSSRELAKQYNISRGTVNVVYEMLQSQGYVQGSLGSGTFVTYQNQQASEKHTNEEQVSNALSSWGKRLEQLSVFISSNLLEQKSDESISFSLGKVDLNHFPTQDWNRLLYEQIRFQYDGELKDSYSTDGHAELKEGIARHLQAFRGIHAQPDDVVIVNGSQKAIALLVQLLIDEGDCVAIENPHYVGARNAVQSVGGKLHPYPVDKDGIIFNPAKEDHYKLIMVTPGRQFPTGAVLSMERRLRLLEWAEANQAYIIEDDYDSEFQHYGRANEPLKSLDKHNRVIYMGTFSRTMMQDIRLGYVVLPQALRKWFHLAKLVYERHPLSIIEQRALAKFISSGLYDRHIRRMKRVYRRKAQLLVEQLSTKLGDALELYPIKSGLHLFAKWKGTEEELVSFLHNSRALGIYAVDASGFYLGKAELTLCFGFAHLTEEQMVYAVDMMQKVLPR